MIFDYKDLKILQEALKLSSEAYYGQMRLWETRNFKTSAKRYKTLLNRNNKLAEEVNKAIEAELNQKAIKHMQSKKYQKGLLNNEL